MTPIRDWVEQIIDCSWKRERHQRQWEWEESDGQPSGGTVEDTISDNEGQ